MAPTVAGRRRSRPEPVPSRAAAAAADDASRAPGATPAERRARSDELLDAWQLRMRSEGNSERTVVERRRVVEVAARCAGQLPTELTTAAILAYLAGLATQGTRATYFAALRAWFAWLIDFAEARPDNPMRKLRPPRKPRSRPRPVTTEEKDRALARISHPRTRAYALLAAYQGLRVHEIAAVRGEHVDVVAGTLRVIGKGGVDAELPLHPAVEAIASSYPRAGWWFPSREDPAGHVRANTVSKVLGAALRCAGVAASAHQLRHWFGTEVLRTAGGNVRVAQKLLRHADLNTTGGYTEINDQERRAALLALPDTSALPEAS